MNTYNINDESFKKTEVYDKFILANPSRGYLKIRAYAASQAIPISGLKIVVSKIVDNQRIIFFEGTTNESGVIEKIVLPAPKLNTDNLNAPSGITYDITATYNNENITNTYKINVYENIYVIQTISLVPNGNTMGGF